MYLVHTRSAASSLRRPLAPLGWLQTQPLVVWLAVHLFDVQVLLPPVAYGDASAASLHHAIYLPMPGLRYHDTSNRDCVKAYQGYIPGSSYARFISESISMYQVSETAVKSKSARYQQIARSVVIGLSRNMPTDTDTDVEDMDVEYIIRVRSLSSFLTNRERLPTGISGSCCNARSFDSYVSNMYVESTLWLSWQAPI